jgi:transglutaminase-like putative cysteine protease
MTCKDHPVLLRIGYDVTYECPQPTPMLLMLNVHFSRVSDLVVPDQLIVNPSVPVNAYRDLFGNWCMRIVAPAGITRLHTLATVHDSGLPDPVSPMARQVPVESLPEEALTFLLGSRYCETDRLLALAWSLFDKAPQGWWRVQAICDYVHNHIKFGYEHARPTRTAFEGWQEGHGVCRDYAHLAVALCRCMNIPARYCTGYISDVNMPLPWGTMDFAAWFEVYLDDGWHTFDARNNKPMFGRVLMARGRDAADVAMITSFGPNELKNFVVICEEIVETAQPAA